MERSYRSELGSDQEHHFSTSYFVGGGELRSGFTDDNTDMREQPPTVKVSVELNGLVLREHPGIEGLVGAELAAQELRGKAAADREAEQLAAFERGLPGFEGLQALEFVFVYDATEAIVVRGPGGNQV